MAKLNQYMFREYDIRGRETEEELNTTTVSLIAKSYGTFLQKRGVKDAVVGHDNRETSKEFYKAAVEGLRSTGVNVIGFGLGLTPMMYWAQYYFKTKGGLMVTSSHNPKGWNGFKLAYGFSYTLIGDEIQEIRRVAESEEFTKGEGSFREESIKEAWINDLVGRAKLHRPLKIVVNTANASSSFFSPDLFRRFGCEVIELNTNPDPEYPNYSPNPANEEMMKDTGERVIENKADLGIGIDADGDRLGLVDEKGQIIWPDRWFILLARLMLEKKPGSKIIVDVKVSESLPEDIRAHGGEPIMWKSGHSYIKQKMHETGAPLAGEMSGHIFFKEGFYGFDDANFAGLKLLEYISSQEESVSVLIKNTPYYISTPAMNIDCPDEKKYQLVEELTNEFKKEGYRVFDVNGARVYIDDGWGLVRASSNLPELVIRFEAKKKETLEKIRKIFEEKLFRYPYVGRDWKTV